MASRRPASAPGVAGTGWARGESVRLREERQARRVLVLVLMIAAGSLVAIDLGRGKLDPYLVAGGPPTATVGRQDTIPGDTSTVVPGASAPGATDTVLQDGPGTFDYAQNPGLVLGGSGTLRTFRVAVETGSGVSARNFADAIDSILGDARGWIADGQLRLQRVAGDTKGSAFTVYLATPATSEKMCREGGFLTDRYTSCRLDNGEVVINLERWLTAIPDYGASLDVYQAYAINHEVGKQLGHGNEACPGVGMPAPVMQQQTLGLKGCLPNAWPYLDGVRYSGPRIP